jgi:hypothetical protein
MVSLLQEPSRLYRWQGYNEQITMISGSSLSPCMTLNTVKLGYKEWDRKFL